MAATIEVGDEVYCKGEKVTITNIDKWVKPFAYYFKTSEGNYVYCHRSDLTKRKPKS